MNTSFNTKHYTYHTGTSLELNSCCLIYWFNSESDFPAVSLANLQETFDQIKPILTEKGMWATRESPDQSFVLSTGNKEISFDHLIYVDSNGANTLGFTYFLGVQSNRFKSSSITQMYLDFKFSVVNTKVDVKISYTLDPIWSHKDPLLQDFFVTTQEEVFSLGGQPRLDFIRYTDDLLQLKSEDNYCSITDSGTLSRMNTWRTWIPTEVSMTRIKDYTKYSIGLYKGNLMLYRWNDTGEFTVDYLSKSNYYGIMEHLKDGRIYLDTDEVIESLEGGVAVFSKQGLHRCGYTSLFDEGVPHRYVDTRKRIILDPWSNTDNITIIDNNKTAEDIPIRYLLCPPGKFFFLLEKKGPWYKFLNEQSGIIAWANVHGTAYFNIEDDSRVVPFSDRVILRLSEEIMEVYSFNYLGQESGGNKEYTLSSKPSITIPLDYSNQDFKIILDSFRHRPLSSMKLKDLSEYPIGFRGYLFHLDREHKIISYL